MKRCIYSAPVSEGEQCRRPCADGTSVGEDEQCFKDCPNSPPVPENEQCMKTCLDGSSVIEGGQCMKTCPHGPSVVEGEQCSDILTYEFQRNFGLSNMRTEYAYEQGHFGAGATVAVVDDGVRVSHNDLKDNIVAGRRFKENDESDAIIDPGDHGTPVAGIIAAARNNIGMHGVAPLAKIIPLHSESPNRLQYTGLARAYAVQSSAHIVNNSYASFLDIEGSFRSTLYRARTPLAVGIEIGSQKIAPLRTESRSAADSVRNADTVMVWGASNEGWQSENGLVRMCSNLTIAVRDCDENQELRVARQDFIDEFAVNITLEGKAVGALTLYPGVQRVSPSFESLMPLYAASDSAYQKMRSGDWTEMRADPNFIAMSNRWLAVVALDRDNKIADYSNGCGDAVEWCLAAPATGTHGTGGGGDDDIVVFSGTSAAAPHVSGALALLKSAGLEMSMTLHRSVLLRTADSTGHLSNSEIYGAGLVNVSAAISMVAGRRTPMMGNLFQSYSPSELGDMLPSEFAHLGDKVGNAEIAVKLDDGFYYNAPLSKLLYPTAKTKTAIGNINAEMTAAIITATASGFAAAGDNETAFALRWNGLGENTALFAEYMQRDYESGAWEKSTGGKIRLRRNLLGGFSAFGEYERQHLQSDTSAGKFLVGTENAQADGWTAGMQWIADSQRNRRFRVWTKERMRLSGGNLLLRYPHYDGDLQVREMRIPLNEKRERIWSAGYAADWGDNGEWTATAAYNDNTGEKKLSARWQLEF